MFKASDQEGRLEIWIPREIESIRFFGSASAAKEVVWSEDEQALVLDDAPTFRFRVSGIPKVPTRFELRVGLRAPRGGSGDPNLLASSVAFRERAVSNGDIVEQVVAWPGQYEHHWLLRSKSTDQFTTIAIVPCDVPSEPAVEEMEISPPADALEKAVAEMQRREGR